MRTEVAETQAPDLQTAEAVANAAQQAAESKEAGSGGQPPEIGRMVAEQVEKSVSVALAALHDTLNAWHTQNCQFQQWVGSEFASVRQSAPATSPPALPAAADEAPVEAGKGKGKSNRAEPYYVG